MADRITVPLSRPIKGPNGTTFTEVVLREPSYDEIVDIGDPYFIAMTRENVPFQVENAEAIKSYLARCIVSPPNPELLSQLRPCDVIDIKDKLLASFQRAAPATAG
jgi:hypothetical protein